MLTGVTLDPAVASTQSGEHLRLLELCYRYAHLRGRQSVGLRLNPEEQAELDSLALLFEGDTARRQHRRFPLLLHAVVKIAGGWCSARVQDISGAGMYLTLSQYVEEGGTVQVRLGRPDEVEYLFTCNVVRVATDAEGDAEGIGLCFCCVPLEMRKARAA